MPFGSNVRAEIESIRRQLDAIVLFQSGMITRNESESEHDALAEKTERMRIMIETKLESEVKAINLRLEQIGRPNWPLLASAISIFIAMIAGVWLIIGLKIDSTLTPLSLAIQESKVTLASNSQRLSSVELLASASTTSDAASKIDRAEINERIRRMDVSINQSITDRAELNQKLAEVETQFCASDIVRNLMHATDIRLLSILWHKTFPGSSIPTDNSYYPVICNRPVKP